MMSAALQLADLGLSVFGVGADCRTPFKVKERFEHGCWDATRDPDEIRWRWTDCHPRGNIAVATGDASGVLVIDVDNKNGIDGTAALARLEEWFSPLPESWLSTTPSEGEHRWFAQPPGLDLVNRVNLPVERDGQRVKLHGLDIRSTGASVCVAPSSKPHGAYRWVRGPLDGASLAVAPDWLLKLCERPPLPPPGPPLRMSDADRIGRYVAAAVNGELDQLMQCRPGGRNQALFIASAKIGEFVGGNLLDYSMAETALESAADAIGLLREDGAVAVRGTIKSGLVRGMAQPREVRP